MKQLPAALVCPDCRGGLARLGAEELQCGGCARRFPLAANGVPVLLPIDSAFDPDKIAAGRDTYYEHRAGEDQRKQRFRRKLPGLAMDLQTGDADALVNRLLAESAEPSGAKVDGLVIGAGFRVEEYAGRFPQVAWLVTDTEATFGADVVGDVLRLPVADASMDLVLCEHVLEHVLDPLAACREIERVLRPGGLALIKVPFNYPWHGGYIDFYRFTPAGYLAAFRQLDVVHLGHGPGPASTVTYAMQQAWTSLFSKRSSRRVAVVVGRLLIGPWRHLDRVLVTRRGSLSSSCSMIFIGRRVEHVRTAAEVVAQAKALGTAPVVAPADR
jgi:SAM-dependent methyltransferase